MANKRLTLEEQLEKDKAALKAMEEAFLEKQKALKEQIANKKKRYNAQYQKKRTHMLCSVAPIFLSIVGLKEDGTVEGLNNIESSVKTLFDALSDSDKTTIRQIIERATGDMEKE
nr:unnamed protein product [uncultured bacterium]